MAEPGEKMIPKSRLDEEIARAVKAEKAAKEAAEALQAAQDKAAKDLQAVVSERDAHKATIEKTRADVAFERAALRAGLTDDDDIAEFRERYDRLQPGEDGKKTAPGDWLGKIKEAPPKWARAYFEPPTKKEEDVEEEPIRPGKVAADPPPKADPPPRSNPNGGASPSGGGKAKKLDDAAVSRFSEAEVSANMKDIAASAEADGLIRMSPETKKRFGLV